MGGSRGRGRGWGGGSRKGEELGWGEETAWPRAQGSGELGERRC